MAYLIDESEFLAHHGILGMKWGKRNGPPYPLSGDISTGSRLKNTNESSSKEKFHLTDKQKTALKVAVGVGVAAVATYALYKTGALDKAATALGQKRVNQAFTTEQLKNMGVDVIEPDRIVPDTILPGGMSQYAIKNRVAAVPTSVQEQIFAGRSGIGYDNFLKEQEQGLAFGADSYSYNCGLTSIGGDLFDRGYASVEANPVKPPGLFFGQLKEAYPGAKVTVFANKSAVSALQADVHYKDLAADKLTEMKASKIYGSVMKEIQNAGPGSRFIFQGTNQYGAGHFIEIKNIDGAIVPIDNQMGKVYSEHEFKLLFSPSFGETIFGESYPGWTGLMRVDNLEPDLDWVRNNFKNI